MREEEKIIFKFVSYFIIQWFKTLFDFKPKMGGEKAPMTTDEAAPYLAIAIAAFPFGRHPLSGKLLFKNEDFGYWWIDRMTLILLIINFLTTYFYNFILIVDLCYLLMQD